MGSVSIDEGEGWHLGHRQVVIKGFRGNCGLSPIVPDLLKRHMNAIVWSLQQDAEHFEPVFDLQVFEGDEREYMDGEMWAHGFMAGIEMQRDGWKALFESRHGPMALRPIYLLGAPGITEAEEELVKTPTQAISRRTDLD